MKLVIGSQKKRDGCITVDCFGDPDLKLDIESAKLPFDSNHFDEIEAFHVLEHTSNFIKIMDELHRVGKSGAVLHIKVPNGVTGFNDPTHVRFFNSQTFQRFTSEFWEIYGTKCWYTDKFFDIIGLIEDQNEIYVRLAIKKE